MNLEGNNYNNNNLQHNVYENNRTDIELDLLTQNTDTMLEILKNTLLIKDVGAQINDLNKICKSIIKVIGNNDHFNSTSIKANELYQNFIQAFETMSQGLHLNALINDLIQKMFPKTSATNVSPEEQQRHQARENEEKETRILQNLKERSTSIKLFLETIKNIAHNMDDVKRVLESEMRKIYT